MNRDYVCGQLCADGDEVVLSTQCECRRPQYLQLAHIDRLYDPDKRGLLIFGLPRSGTHHLMRIISTRLSDVASNIIELDEINEHGDVGGMQVNRLYQNGKYTISTCVSNRYITELFSDPASLLNEFVTIKLTRLDYLGCIVSWLVRERVGEMLGNDQIHVITDRGWLQSLDTPWNLLGSEFLEMFIRRINRLVELPCHYTADYEDIRGIQSSVIRSNYHGYTTEHFIKDSSLVLAEIQSRTKRSH